MTSNWEQQEVFRESQGNKNSFPVWTRGNCEWQRSLCVLRELLAGLRDSLVLLLLHVLPTIRWAMRVDYVLFQKAGWNVLEAEIQGKCSQCFNDLPNTVVPMSPNKLLSFSEHHSFHFWARMNWVASYRLHWVFEDIHGATDGKIWASTKDYLWQAYLHMNGGQTDSLISNFINQFRKELQLLLFLSIYTYNSTYPGCTDMEGILLYNAPKMPKMMERSIKSWSMLPSWCEYVCPMRTTGEPGTVSGMSKLRFWS